MVVVGVFFSVVLSRFVYDPIDMIKTTLKKGRKQLPLVQSNICRGHVIMVIIIIKIKRSMGQHTHTHARRHK